MIRILKIAALLTTIIASAVLGATVGSIRGTVTDAKSGDPLIAVNIILDGTSMGGITDETGYYTIINIPLGVYKIRYSMIGYGEVVVDNVRVIMDQSTNIDVRMNVEAYQGETVTVTAERPMVEKDITGKKVVMESEQIINMPVRDLSEVYTLQSGVIQVKTAELGIPGFEDRGIEQIHVRGGRANETGFMIDGLYIENPIYGGRGVGRHLNQYAVRDVNFQTGFFNAEYGDAMSGMINTITRTGSDRYEGSFRWERSNFGDFSQKQDQLRDYDKMAGGIGGPLFNKRLRWYTSFHNTKQAYSVLKFDDIVYQANDLNNDINRANNVHVLDTVAGWRGFGFNNHHDWFTKAGLELSPKIRLSASYWSVGNEYKVFDPAYLFYDLGKNEVQQSAERYSIEWRHQLGSKTYYTINYADFTQKMTMGVRNYDTDNDGYPDWLEMKQNSNFRDPDDIPAFQNNVYDNNGNLIYVPGDPLTFAVINNDTLWRYGDELTEWLTAEQYPSYGFLPLDEELYNAYLANPDSLYYISYMYEFLYSGADRYFHETYSRSKEARFDITSQFSRHHQIQTGISYREHIIRFNEVQLPWLATPYTENYKRFPKEMSGYLQDKVEYPWMVINAGIRFDASNSNDKMWQDPRKPDSILVDTEWSYLLSPRLGFSHVITDQATFTFGYGIYYQNPTYRNVYLNVDKRDDMDSFFNTPRPLVGNPAVTAQKVVSYEFGFNQQLSRYWVLGLVGWSKDYTNMNSTEEVRVGSVKYTVFVNYDYGSSRGIDLILEKRGGGHYSGMLQYTYSSAKGNRPDPWAGYRATDNPLTMPKKEVLQEFDRTHDMSLTLNYHLKKREGLSLGGFYPLQNTRLSMSYVLLSGAPYTPIMPDNTAGAANSERMPMYYNTNLALRKYIVLPGDIRLTIGSTITNVFNRRNPLYVYPTTGSADDPGRRALDNIRNGYTSSTFYDRPWYYDDYRNIDLFFEIDF